MIERRSLITGLVALVAAPAIVRVASLMPVNAALQPGLARLDVLWGSMEIWLEWVWRPRLPNDFIVTDGPTPEFVFDSVRIPNDYTIVEGPGLMPFHSTEWVKGFEIQESLSLTPFALAAAAVAVAPQILEKPVTRRFWSK